MRTAGAGLSQSSQSLHWAANCGPVSSIGAIGFSTAGGGFPSGTTTWFSWAAAARNARLTNITPAVHVDGAAGRRSGRIGCQPADHLGDLVGGCDPAERNVGDDLGSAAAGEIFLGHLGDGEARRDRETEDAIARIAARDRLGHRHDRALGRSVMPVLRAVAAKGGAARYVDDPARNA